MDQPERGSVSVSSEPHCPFFAPSDEGASSHGCLAAGSRLEVEPSYAAEYCRTPAYTQCPLYADARAAPTTNPGVATHAPAVSAHSSPARARLDWKRLPIVLAACLLLLVLAAWQPWGSSGVAEDRRGQGSSTGTVRRAAFGSADAATAREGSPTAATSSVRPLPSAEPSVAASSPPGLGETPGQPTVVETAEFEPTPAEPAPSAPLDLRATPLSPRSVLLTWRQSEGRVTSFGVERSSAGSRWTVLGAVDADVFSYLDRGVTPDRTYRYRVRTYGVGTRSEYSRTARLRLRRLDEDGERRGETGERYVPVALDATVFQGGYWRAAGYKGTTAEWVYGRGTRYSTMTAEFRIGREPKGDRRGLAGLAIVGMDAPGAQKARVRISLNRRKVYVGANRLGNEPSGDGRAGWTEWTLRFPESHLRVGRNRLTIANLDRTRDRSASYLVLDAAVVVYYE